MAMKGTTSSSLKNQLKVRMRYLANTFDIGICCSKCVVTEPDGPKDEYYLIGNTPEIDDGVWFSGHLTCSRDWILCKTKSTPIWFRVRPIYEKCATMGEISKCKYAGRNCPSGDMCVDAHSDVEKGVWTLMIQLDLNFHILRGVLLDEIEQYKINAMKNREQLPKSETTSEYSSDVNAMLAIPADAVRPGCRYEEQGFFVLGRTKTYMSVRATRVDNPDKLFLQLCDNIEPMNEWMNNMDMFYKSNEGNKYAMQVDDLLRRLPVAASMYSKEAEMWTWRRAEIIDFTVKGQNCLIEVIDVDTGYTASVKLEEVRLLRGQYLAFQKQAIVSAIAYVRPATSDHWSPEAIQLVRKYFEKTPLIAEVVGTVATALGVMVCDTSDPDTDVYVADLLVTGGYATVINNVDPMDV